ncbi:RNA polymerase sigma factor [Terriglobus sp.]|uniref:RNA polymerase sigma factor n=1 Tax=Terriglobus sp. TaxID=1889013 RepID=UPI003B0014BA
MTFPRKPAAARVFSSGNRVSTPVHASAATASLSAAALAEASAREQAEIAHGLKRQDPELLDRLIDTYQHRLMRYLSFLTGRRELAEDLFQETWIRVLLRGAQFNGKARFDTWLFTIARNLVIDQSRKRSMASLDEMQDPEADERPFEVATDAPSPFDQFCTRENAAEVSAVLLSLQPAYREVLILRFHEDLPLEEIASVTRAPLSTVKSRLYRGLAALKPELERLRTQPIAAPPAAGGHC